MLGLDERRAFPGGELDSAANIGNSDDLLIVYLDNALAWQGFTPRVVCSLDMKNEGSGSPFNKTGIGGRCAIARCDQETKNDRKRYKASKKGDARVTLGWRRYQ